MIALPVTLLPRRETSSLSVTPVPAIIESFCLWKDFHNGKTHLSISMAIKALMKGYKVLFTPVSEMLHNLNAAKADNTYYQKVDYYLKPDLLILDELGFKR
ncbi:MAG: ATP-binding protein, partial [Candidatus Atribacteria bacterium]|nr:ATP-binding protein [Candidatus Atribacteria bacterium]